MRRTQSWKSPGAAEIGDLLEPVIRPLDFIRRGRRALWTRAEAGDHLLMWVQFDGRPDPYAGDEFRINFERSSDPKPARKLGGRVQLDQLLRAEEIDLLLRAQNIIIARLPKPTVGHVSALPADLQPRYLSWFETAEYEPGFQCRFRTEDDLKTWMGVFTDVLPRATDRAAQLIEPHRLYHQRENLLGDAELDGL